MFTFLCIITYTSGLVIYLWKPPVYQWTWLPYHLPLLVNNYDHKYSMITLNFSYHLHLSLSSISTGHSWYPRFYCVLFRTYSVTSKVSLDWISWCIQFDIYVFYLVSYNTDGQLRLCQQLPATVTTMWSLCVSPVHRWIQVSLDYYSSSTYCVPLCSYRRSDHLLNQLPPT